MDELQKVIAVDQGVDPKFSGFNFAIGNNVNN